MRKFGFLIVALLLLGVVAGSVSASNDYKEVQKNEYWVSWDGSARVTLKTIFYSPEEMLNQTKQSILKMGLENATKLFITQESQVLSQLGLSLENATAEILGYNTTGPLVTVINGTIPNFARYYSYDNSWEISLDALRIVDLSRIDPTAVNGSMYLENYFTVHLPEGAKVENVTKGFRVESNGSYIQLDVNATGDTIMVHSIIYLKKGITKDDLSVLYSKLEPVMITYTGKRGVENYTTWEMKIYNNITVQGDKTILDTTEEYIKPEEYINYIKVQFAYQGLQQAEQSLYQKYAQTFESKGIKVLSGNVSILNVNSTGPLVVKYHWVLQGFVSKVNDTYVYNYDPRLELGNMDFPYRLNAAINETKVTRITLPEGYKFVEVPKSIDVKTKAGNVVMKVTKVNDREVLIESNVYLRYGIPAEAYKELMAKVPDNVEFKYVVKAEEGNGICGPALLVGLALLPLLLLRRR
ncbi:CGP-CTERM sorting domain-containing protein [Thermococcus sp.]|uniref:CGP-CTERM sorting domain-containing protein n=1 Tax=Thermococcus sp. TaxID=35749 RepID=UPI0025F16D11|nr:CGP-CTERM sorting domain-containing protein [Thermococcus sp.]